MISTCSLRYLGYRDFGFVLHYVTVLLAASTYFIGHGAIISELI